MRCTAERRDHHRHSQGALPVPRDRHAVGDVQASSGWRRGSSSFWCLISSFSSPSRTRAGPGEARIVKLAYLARQSHLTADESWLCFRGMRLGACIRDVLGFFEPLLFCSHLSYRKFVSLVAFVCCHPNGEVHEAKSSRVVLGLCAGAAAVKVNPLSQVIGLLQGLHTKTDHSQIKPHVEGRLLRFDFERQAQAGLRFNFGVYEDGVWTPITLPWLTVTLMDFDCGKTSCTCERVESADHARHEANFERHCRKGTTRSGACGLI